jgi:hypothetical protein
MTSSDKTSVPSVDLPSPESWARLVAFLHYAAEVDRTEMAGAEMPGHRASWVASFAVLAFLIEQPALGDPAIVPVLRLTAALADLRHGKVSAMFKPARAPGRSPNSSAFECIKGVAARTMTELMASGQDKWEAARLVARACGTMRGYGAVTSKTVAGWRNVLEAGAGPGAPERGAALFAYNKPLPASYGAAPRERARKLLVELRRHARQLI